MTQRFTRWAVAPVLLLALTGCTQLTNADGFAPTPTPTTTPSATTNTWLESAAENPFGLPEVTTEAFTKETLPDPEGIAPEEATNAVSLGDIEATKTKRSLRLPKPFKNGTVWAEFVCVDGEINIDIDYLGGMGFPCDGTTQGLSFNSAQAFKSLKIDLAVSPGTSYSVAVYQQPDGQTIID